MITFNTISPARATRLFPKQYAHLQKREPDIRFSGESKPKDSIDTMSVSDIIHRGAAIAWSKPTGVDKEMKALSGSIDDKQSMTIPHLIIAFAPFIIASLFMMPWMGLLGLPWTIYRLIKLRKLHHEIDQTIRQQYRAVTDKLNIVPDFPYPHGPGPLPTKPAKTA